MLSVNKEFLSKVLEDYTVENTDLMNDMNILSYSLKEIKKRWFQFGREEFFVHFYEDEMNPVKSQDILDRITEFDKQYSIGHDYIVILPKKCYILPDNAELTQNNDEDLLSNSFCFNGKSFVHFVLCDSEERKVMYWSDFYYSGSKKVLKLMGLYKECFENMV